ncbi:MAG TPA: hypothetical protein IAB44_17275 [Candidatus Limivivens intestinipullorum]|uniref:Peptidoglycan binding-like domain-containing protein n=1 Tax=Candidatus Limivivens intestinipullorum TaxID=2840858 RepID=A0A9D1JLY6_9FIRM|nr:hypothetical protein [Candidatus Limivivens intestinipullorum]
MYAPSANTAAAASVPDASSSISANTASDSTSGVISTSGLSIKLSSGTSVSLSKDLIKIVQDVLNQKGYDCGTADGVVGTKTQEALENFMEDNKISAIREAACS